MDAGAKLYPCVHGRPFLPVRFLDQLPGDFAVLAPGLSIVVAGHKTSVSLEDAFWKGLKEIAGERDTTLSELVGTIDSERENGNLSSAVRLFVLDFYRTQLSDLKEGRDGSDGESESSGAVRIRRIAQARH